MGRGSPGSEIVHHGAVAERDSLVPPRRDACAAHDRPGHVERVGSGHHQLLAVGGPAVHLEERGRCFGECVLLTREPDDEATVIYRRDGNFFWLCCVSITDIDPAKARARLQRKSGERRKPRA